MLASASPDVRFGEGKVYAGRDKIYARRLYFASLSIRAIFPEVIVDFF